MFFIMGDLVNKILCDCFFDDIGDNGVDKIDCIFWYYIVFVS